MRHDVGNTAHVGAGSPVVLARSRQDSPVMRCPVARQCGGRAGAAPCLRSPQRASRRSCVRRAGQAISCRASKPDGAAGVVQAAPEPAQRAGNLRQARPPADVWQTKPAWCQPWTILATGSSAVGGAWLLSGHRVWVACLVALPVGAWCAVPTTKEYRQASVSGGTPCLNLVLCQAQEPLACPQSAG